jgi:phenylalanyl-tRNA synthetase beta chain
LESAFFDPVLLAGKARRYGLHTDSSHRFERGVDFELQRRAIERATGLLLSIVGGQPGPVIEQQAADYLPALHPIILRQQRITQVLGFTLPEAEIEAILERLGMDLVRQSSSWHIVPPSWRFDIRIEEDLIEELGRVWGYDRIPVQLPEMAFSPGSRSESMISVERLGQLLVDRDYQEAITFSFMDASLLQRLEPKRQALALANPISAELSHMRTTLWAGLLRAAQHNANRQQSRIRLFETGLAFLPEADGRLQQIPRLAGLITGAVQRESWHAKNVISGFFDIKGDVEALLALNGRLETFVFEAAVHPALHPGQSACIKLAQCDDGADAGVVGWIGALHPAIQAELGFLHPVLVFELNLSEITHARLPAFRELSRVPEVKRDIALVVDEKIPARSILAVIREAAGEWLTDAVVFDVYKGTGVPEGHRSLAFGLRWRHPSRTLKDDEVNDLFGSVVDRLKASFNVTLRE